jgi:hypothetical protein
MRFWGPVAVLARAEPALRSSDAPRPSSAKMAPLGAGLLGI